MKITFEPEAYDAKLTIIKNLSGLAVCVEYKEYPNKTHLRNFIMGRQ